jgi:hypothetical protein
MSFNLSRSSNLLKFKKKSRSFWHLLTKNSRKFSKEIKKISHLYTLSYHALKHACKKSRFNNSNKMTVHLRAIIVGNNQSLTKLKTIS